MWYSINRENSCNPIGHVVKVDQEKKFISLLTKAKLDFLFGLITTSKVFLAFTTQLYQYFSVFFSIYTISDEPEVLLPKYSQTGILLAAHSKWVTKPLDSRSTNLIVISD